LALGAGSFDQASVPAPGAGPAAPRVAPYLAGQLRGKGQLLSNYYAVGHGGLTGAIALISGQPPNPDTQAECPLFSDMAPTGLGASGLAVGRGCVYPAAVRTIADQLTTAGRSWKAYVEDMDRQPGQSPTCRHPIPGGPDITALDRPGDGYAMRHNPFAYFHSVIDGPDCAKNDLPLSRLSTDLRSERKTPSFAYLAPSLCNGGDVAPCADGRPGGYPAADAFLKRWVPEILRSPAYRKSGLLVITFDEAPAVGPAADSRACCGEQPGLATPNPGGLLKPGPGGGKVGALVLSPFVAGGDVNDRPYNHYALLHSMQSLLGLGSLGYSGQRGLPTFGSDVLTKPAL
ncbi:MAG: phosphoesterase, partial [Pseudonocardiales bacterium]